MSDSDIKQNKPATKAAILAPVTKPLHSSDNLQALKPIEKPVFPAEPDDASEPLTTEENSPDEVLYDAMKSENSAEEPTVASADNPESAQPPTFQETDVKQPAQNNQISDTAPIKNTIDHTQLHDENSEAVSSPPVPAKKSTAGSQVTQPPVQKKPQLPAIGHSNDKTLSNKTEALLNQEIVSAGQALGSDDPEQTESYLQDRLNQMAQDSAILAAEQYISDSLEAHGSAEISTDLNSDWSFARLEINYLMPLVRTENSSHFIQMGTMYKDGRTFLNAGFGFRRIYQNRNSTPYLLGINSFLDGDIKFGHYRMSVGAELATDDMKLFSNVYQPVSSWKKQEVSEDGYHVEARAASGFDLGIKGYLPQYRALSGSVKYFKWFEDNVDLDDNFRRNTSGDNWNEMSRGNQGYDLTLAWNPVPLFGASYTKTLSDSSLQDSKVSLDMNYNLSQSLDQQLQPEAAQSAGMLDNMLDAMVERNNEIVLAYRTDSNIPFKVYIPSLWDAKELEEKETVTFSSVEVSSPLPIRNYQWELVNSAEAAEFDITIDTLLQGGAQEKNPEFLAPPWNTIDAYDLRLAITDVRGVSTRSDIHSIRVMKEGYLNEPELTFYLDENKTGKVVEQYKVAIGAPEQALYWKLLSTLPDADKNKDLCASSDDCKKSWTDKSTPKILKNLDAQYPVIDNTVDGPGSGQYEVFLDVKSETEGSPKVNPTLVAIELTKSESDIRWTDNTPDDSSKTVDYDPGETKIKSEAVSNAFKDLGSITYRIDNKTPDDLADIDPETGELTLTNSGGGSADIYAVHTPDEQGKKYFTEKEISYKLTVNPSTGYEVQWNNPDIKNDKLKITYSDDLTVDSSAKLIKGTYDSVVYTSDNSAVASFEDDQIGTASVNKAGKALITAIFHNKEDAELVRKSFTLTVNKAVVTDFIWANNVIKNKEEIKANVSSWPTDFGYQAGSDTFQDPVVYSSDDDGIAGVNNGKINLNGKEGKVTITATLEANEKHEKAEISYSMIVAKDNDHLSWSQAGAADIDEVFCYINKEESDTTVTQYLNSSVFDEGSDINYTFDADPPENVGIDNDKNKVTVNLPAFSKDTSQDFVFTLNGKLNYQLPGSGELLLGTKDRIYNVYYVDGESSVPICGKE